MRMTTIAAIAVVGLAALTPDRARAEQAPAAASLSLERVIELAIARDERAAIAGQNAASASARIDKARSFFFPTVTVSGAYTRRGRASEFQEYNALSATLQVGLTLFDARGFPLYRQAKYESQAADLEAREQRRLLAFEAADAYLATLGQERVVAAAEHRVEFARQNLADTKARAAASISSSNDATRAELELATAERELVRARAELDTAYLQLGHLIGVDIQPPLAAPATLLAAANVPPGLAKQLTGEAQTRRMDLAANREHARAAWEFADEPRMRWFPSLGLAGQARATNESGLANATNDWFISVTATWELWDGGERGADTAEREAQARIAELEVSATARTIALEVRTALAQLAHAQELVGHAQAAVDAARKNVNETSVLYKQGLARAIEVADATAGLFDAEVALARESYGLGVALLDLRAALGLDPLGREPTKS